MAFETIAIAGVGLIGGSFGLALRQAGFPGRILGVSSPSTILKATARGAIDAGVSLDEACSQADLLLLAQPVSVILEVLPRLQTKAWVTDAGSTKSLICAAGHAALGDRFFGSHPMAGSEARSIDAASASLFQGRPWICTSPPPPDFAYWITQIGAHLLILTPEEHDHLVALSSHLPQLLSTTLAATLASTDAARTAGPGLTDMTRLALSSYDLWRDILSTNPAAIRAALASFRRELDSLDAALADPTQLEALFASASRFARNLRRS